MAKPSALARLDVPLVAKAMDQLEAELGGRQTLIGILTLAPLTPDLRTILGLLADPTFGKYSLATICARSNILPGDLLKQLEGALLLRGRVLAAQQVAKGLPAVAADVMRRAAPYEEACTDCQGTGTITPDPTQKVPNPLPGPCTTCAGGGRLTYAPDLRRQELALEMGRMLPKAQGIQILNQQFQPGGAGGAGGGSLEALHRVTDQILYGEVADTTPLDGEVIPGAEPLQES